LDLALADPVWDLFSAFALAFGLGGAIRAVKLSSFVLASLNSSLHALVVACEMMNSQPKECHQNRKPKQEFLFL